MPQAQPSETYPPGSVLRLLSYNIQTGIDCKQYRDYVTKGWRHLLPFKQRRRNMQRIAALVQDYDLVGLQEVDGGSLRTDFVDMTEYFARKAEYPHWFNQVNRNIGIIAQNSNGFLSRIKPDRITKHALPPGNGRGAMLMEFGKDENALKVCSMHLALSKRVRALQLDYIADLLTGTENLVVMGDFNMASDSTEMKLFIEKNNFSKPLCQKPTYPSWQPVRRIDHILVSQALEVRNAQVLDYPLSDHLPVSLELLMPNTLRLAA